MKKLPIPSRLADTAAAVAAAFKSPTPTRSGDAMLEVELPETVDAAAMAAAMFAMGAALERMAGSQGATEIQLQEMGAEMGAANIELDQLRSRIDSLQADADFGRQHRLDLVVAVAKKVAGLTDADVEGKDADAVRRAAVAKRYPKVNPKHLDISSTVDAMWTVMASDAEAQPAVDPKAGAGASGKQANLNGSTDQRSAPNLQRATPVADSRGDVDGGTPPRRKLTALQYS